MGTTRCQIITFLWRLAGYPEFNKDILIFEDVSVDSYYAGAIAWAYENGITNGTSKNTFSPDKPCSRAEIITFLYNAKMNNFYKI